MHIENHIKGDVTEYSVSADEIVRFAADELGIAVAQLRSRRRTVIELVGRRVAVHAAARIGMCGARIAGALGLSQQAVSKIGREPPEPAIIALVTRVLDRALASGPRVIHTMSESCV